jgi:hypothetical protein
MNEAVVVLAAALTVNTTLRKIILYLHPIRLSAPAYDAFSAMLRVNTSLVLDNLRYVIVPHLLPRNSSFSVRTQIEGEANARLPLKTQAFQVLNTAGGHMRLLTFDVQPVLSPLG